MFSILDIIILWIVLVGSVILFIVYLSSVLYRTRMFGKSNSPDRPTPQEWILVIVNLFIVAIVITLLL